MWLGCRADRVRDLAHAGVVVVPGVGRGPSDQDLRAEEQDVLLGLVVEVQSSGFGVQV